MLHIIIAIPTSAVLKPAQAGLVYNEENSMKQSIKKY
jgi:hypothetical protein